MSLKDKIIGYDLDGTLCHEHCWTIEDVEKSTLNKEVAEDLLAAYQMGFIIIYTARKDELIPATLAWLRKNNIRYHAFSNIKTPLDVYIDDHSYHHSKECNEDPKKG